MARRRPAPTRVGRSPPRCPPPAIVRASACASPKRLYAVRGRFAVTFCIALAEVARVSIPAAPTKAFELIGKHSEDAVHEWFRRKTILLCSFRTIAADLETPAT